MDLKLADRTAMVTGGTRGIGRAIVETLLREGCRVAFCARTAEAVEAAAEQLSAIGPEVTGSTVDVADGAAVKNWVESTADAAGGLDIFISNASALAVENSADAWQRSLQVDVLCPLHAVEAAQPHLEAAAAKRGDAAVLAISSISGALSMNAQAYGAMKAALDHYISGLAKDLAPTKIRANTLSPGTIYFEDGFWGSVERDNPEFFASMIDQNPLGRMGSPQEIADGAAFLVSPRASFITGSNMVVDGGFLPCVRF